MNTLAVVANYAAIPNKLNFDARYSVSYGVDQQLLLTAAPTSACSNCQGQFPNDTTLFQRLDLSATYKFDPLWVDRWGYQGRHQGQTALYMGAQCRQQLAERSARAVHSDPADLDLARVRQPKLQCANDRCFAHSHLVTPEHDRAPSMRTEPDVSRSSTEINNGPAACRSAMEVSA